MNLDWSKGSHSASGVGWLLHWGLTPEHDGFDGAVLVDTAPTQAPDVLDIRLLCIPRSLHMISNSEQSEFAIEHEARCNDVGARVGTVDKTNLTSRVGHEESLGGPRHVACGSGSPDAIRACSN